MKKLFIFLTMLVVGIVSSWAIDVKIADYSSIQPWASSGAIINRSANKLTLTSTDASGVAGTTLVTSGGYWDRYDKWLQIVPGTTDEVTYTVTLTAPTGYTIVGYVIECCSWNANRTYVVTAADNTTVTTTNTAIQTLNVKNLDVTSTTFTVNGKATSSSNVYFTIKNMTVALVKKQGTRLNSTATGVTWNNNNDPTKWNNTWTSGTTPNIKLTCGTTWNSNLAGNMHRGNNVDGAFYLHTNNTPYYTLIMDGNYMITGYTIVGTASGDFDFTPTSGTADGSFKRQQTKAVHVTGLASNSVGFKVSPGGHAFIDATIYIEYETYTPVTSTNNTKSYYITTADRSSWVVASGATQVNATSKTGTIAGQKFAFIRYDDAKDDSNDGTYLYSVSEGKFISKSGSYTTLTEFPGDKVSVLTSENTKFPTVIALNGGSSHAGISNGYNPAVITSYNSLSDGGNCCAIIEADDFDATDVLAKIEDYFHPSYTVTYKVKDGSDNILFTSDAVPTTLGANITTLPAEYQLTNFYEYNTVDVTISASGNTDVVFTATPKDEPLVRYTADTSNPYYYNLNIRSQYLVYNSEATGQVTLQSTSEPFNPNASWAFIGEPYAGFKLINKTKGTGYFLTYTSVVTGGNGGSDGSNNNVQFVAAADFNNRYWIVDKNTGGFCMRMKENTNIYFHHQNIQNATGYLRTCSVAEWSSVHNDAGSTIVASTDEDLLIALYNSMKDYTYSDAIGQYSAQDVTAADANLTITQVGAAITNNMTTAYGDAYAALNELQGKTSLNTPAAGFYRVKNVATEGYLYATAASGYTSTDRYVFANGSNSGAETIVQLVEHEGHLYMLNQGHEFGWVAESSTGSGQVGYVRNKAFDKYVNWLPGTAAGQIAFAICYGNGTGNHASYLTQGIYAVDSNDNAVIRGTEGYTANTAQWVFEEVSTLGITLNGPVNSYYYATLCLPFDVTITSGANAYTLEESDGWLVPTAVEDNKVPAGTPVLLKGTSALATATINTASAFNSGSPLDCALTGTYLPKTIAGSTDYVLGKYEGKVGFYHWSSNNLAANRAYLAGSSNNARGFALMFDDDATGIVSTPGETEEGITIYNLSGQRLNKMQKGINIVNGKKVLF